MAQWHRLVLKLSGQTKTGSEKYFLKNIFRPKQVLKKYNFLLEGISEGVADLGMTMRALPCAGTLPPGADSFER